jgi:hypothetical protein
MPDPLPGLPSRRELRVLPTVDAVAADLYDGVAEGCILFNTESPKKGREMHRISLIVAGVVVGACLGCGPSATDTSNAVPAPSAEQTTQEIEKAMESGTITPESYGKY